MIIKIIMMIMIKVIVIVMIIMIVLTICIHIVVFFNLIHNVFFFSEAADDRKSDHFVINNFPFSGSIHHNTLGRRLNMFY